jgi:hypothetical protein
MKKIVRRNEILAFLPGGGPRLGQQRGPLEPKPPCTRRTGGYFYMGYGREKAVSSSVSEFCPEADRRFPL